MGIINFFTGLPGRVVAVLGAALALLGGLVLMRREAKKDGAREQRERHEEEAREVQERMDSVDDASSSDVDDSLQRHDF